MVCLLLVINDAIPVSSYTRDWRYHKELQLWITRDADSQPVTATTHETGTYVVFDVKTWKKVRGEMAVVCLRPVLAHASLLRHTYVLACLHWLC